jgi:hypothetical protein
MNGGTLGTTVAGITLANNQIWGGNFSGSVSSGQALTTTGTNTITGGTRVVSFNTVGANINGTIADGGNNYGLILRNTTSAASVALGGANTFGGGLTITGTTGNALTVTTNNASAVGSGQTTLTNSTGSVLKLGSALTVDSLTSGIAAPSITGGTGYTNGTQDLVFTGGGGSGAVGTATISGGVITSVSITNYGRDYTGAPTITLTTPGAGTGGAITSAFGSSSVNLQANTLTLAGTNASAATYAGIISGTSGNLIKTGAGTQLLTGGSTYTGATTVSGGILGISNAGSINGTSGVIVNGGNFAYNSSTSLTKAITMSSGFVSGTGTVGTLTANGGLITSTGTAGAVTINAGGAINPGGSGAGVFNAASLTWNSDGDISGLRFDLGADALSSDKIILTGAFTKGTGSTFVFDFTDAGASTSITYTLLTFGSSSGFTAGDFSANGVAGTFGLDANSLTFTVSAVPEPSTLALIMGAIVLAGVVHQRRRTRAV